MPRPKKDKPNRADGRYEVKATIGQRYDGTLIRKSFYSDISKEDARKQAEKYKIEHKAAQMTGTFIVDQEINFETWANQWLDTFIKPSGIKGGTYNNNYDIPLRLHLIPWFGGKKLGEILTIDVQKFFNEKSKTTSIDTLRKYRRCLKNLFDAAVENELCHKNPVTKSIKIKSEKKPEDKRFYTFAQRDLVVEYAKTHKNGLAIIVMLHTGISRSELLGLRWEDVTEDLVMHIRRGVVTEKDPETGKWDVVISDGLKTDFRARSIPIEKWLYDLIQKKPRTVKLGGSVRNKTPVEIVWTEYIFHNSKGQIQRPENFSSYCFDPFMQDMETYYAKKNNNIPALNPHELRHTWATLLSLRGVDLYTIAKLGGWSDLKMLSKVYGHSDVEALRESLGYNRQPGTTVVKVSSGQFSKKIKILKPHG